MVMKEKQLKRELLLLYAAEVPQEPRRPGDPFEQQKQQIRSLLEARRLTAPGSHDYLGLVSRYREILDGMVEAGLDKPVEDELLDEDWLGDKYREFEKRWNEARPYTVARFIEEKCSFICMVDVLRVESGKAQARVVRQYKGELSEEVWIRFYTPWGMGGTYKEGERAVVFLDGGLLSLGRLGRMPIIERGGVEYAVSYNENPDFWPDGTPISRETLGGEEVLLIELGVVEAILGEYKQKSRASQKYALGRFYLNLFSKQFTKDSLIVLRKATRYFDQARRLDETCAEAHSGLAACYTAAGIYNIAPPEESFGRALGPAKRALELNSRLAEVHAALGYAHMCYGWDWPAAESEYRQALEIDPDYALARQGLAHWLAAMERSQDALVEIDLARASAPESLMVNVVRGFILYYGGYYEESWAQFDDTIRLNPHFDATYYGLALACEPLAMAYMERGEVEEAKKMFKRAGRAARKAVKLSHGNPVKLAAQAHVHALSGEADKAQQELQQLIALSTEQYVSPFQIATIYAAMVTTCAALERSSLAVEYYEQALKYLDVAYKTRDQWLVLLKVEPRFTILHGDERFKDLIRKLNFPPAARLDPVDALRFE